MDLSLLLLVFSFIFTVASRLLHLYSTDNKTSRLKMNIFSTLRDTQRGSLFLKTMICFSGCLMSSASIQKLFCGVCSALKCSFDEFVREKVVSPSYSSAILVPPSHLLFLKKHFPAFKVVSRKTEQDTLACCELLHSPWKWKILGLILYFIIYLMCSTDRHYLTFLYLLFFNLSSYFSTLLILLPLL